jgi:SAM-dependent methyltransferase
LHEKTPEVTSLQAIIRRLFFALYTRLIINEKNWARCLLLLTVRADGLLNFRFLREYARRQHAGFSLRDEILVLKLIGEDVLDLGCGMGYWGIVLKDPCRNVVGVDVSSSYLHLVKMLKVYEALLKGSASELPFRTGRFDTVLAIETIEHLSKQDGLELLRQAKEVSDRVIVTTPLDISGNENLPDWVPESEHHLSSWTEQDFRKEGFATLCLGQTLLAIADAKQAGSVSSMLKTWFLYQAESEKQ